MAKQTDPTNGSFKKYKKMYPDLDESSFTHGYVAAINDLVRLGKIGVAIDNEEYD